MSHPTTENAGSRTDSSDFSESELYEVLANDRRRLALEILADRGEPLSLAELASSVQAHETAGAGTDGDTAVIGLHHIHLPKLDDAGLVDYDPEVNRVDPRVEDVDLDLA